MRVREKQITFWMTYDEYYNLKGKADKVGLSVSELIRELTNNYEPREKPPEQFYEAIKQIRAVGNSLNQLARKANALGFIDELQYKKNVDTLNGFILDIKKEFLLQKKHKKFLANYRIILYKMI